MNVVPCKNCEERQTRCHSTFERYVAYRKVKDEEKEKRSEMYIIDDATALGAERMRKSYHKYRKEKK